VSDDRKSTTYRIFEKIEKVENHLHEINLTLEKQHQSLAEHMRRTQLLEQEMRPVVKHVEQVRGAGILLGFLALLSTIVSVYLVFKP
jgi:hypothetical protein